MRSRLVRRVYDAFGSNRMMWGGLGASMPEFRLAQMVFNELLDFAPEKDKAQIRGVTAAQLFGWTS